MLPPPPERENISRSRPKATGKLAQELGISITTVRRWRNRSQISDNHTTPHLIHKVLRQEQEILINALRDALRAPLDELLFMVNEGLGIAISRATLNRYLRPAHEGRKNAAPQGKKALKAGMRADTLTLHYRQLALSMDDGGEHHLLWAQEPISGWCFGRIYSGISPALVDIWLTEALNACPAQIQCLETYAHKGFEPIRADLSCVTVMTEECGAVQLSERLADIIPALDEPDATLQRLCTLWKPGAGAKETG